MCCFSRAVLLVTKTKIFARSPAPGRQLLAYSMQLSAREDLAMVLPIPVPPGSREDAVRFIDLSGYAKVLEDLNDAFPVEYAAAAKGGISRSFPMPQSMTLRVHDVGDFEASFVPAVADFARLDERFRLPDGVWDSLPQYRDYGFAVFKLRNLTAGKKGFMARLFGRASDVAPKRIHPMAFEFPTSMPDQLFFPTVHIHDGVVHEEASFDHSLFWQGGTRGEGEGAEISASQLAAGVKLAQASGLFDPELPTTRRTLAHKLPNRDTLVSRV